MSTNKKTKPASKPPNLAAKKPAPNAQKPGPPPSKSQKPLPGSQKSMNSEGQKAVQKKPSREEGDFEDLEEEGKMSAQFPGLVNENSVSLIGRGSNKHEGMKPGMKPGSKESLERLANERTGMTPKHFENTANFNEKNKGDPPKGPNNFADGPKNTSENALIPPERPQKLQERPPQERPLQERPPQERPLQERALQERALQERALQERALQERALQERALQERALQERALQERALKERALQERALQERALEERTPKERTPQDRHHQQERLPQERPPEERPVTISQKQIDLPRDPSLGMYGGLTKRQVLHKLTEKVFILTDELERLSKLASTSLEDSQLWKQKYTRLKDLYVRNVDEDLNPQQYFEGLEYSLQLKPENQEGRLTELKQDRETTQRLLKTCQDSIKDIKGKLENNHKGQRERGARLKELEIGLQNRLKVLQNELEMLRTEQGNRGKAEEKYDRVLKEFLALKGEKDAQEREFQRKLGEIEGGDVGVTVPSEGVEGTTQGVDGSGKVEQKKMGEKKKTGKK